MVLHCMLCDMGKSFLLIELWRWMVLVNLLRMKDVSFWYQGRKAHS